MYVAKTGIDFSEFGFEVFVSVESLFTRFPAFILEQFKVCESTKSSLRRRTPIGQDASQTTQGANAEHRATHMRLVETRAYELNDALKAFITISNIDHFV